MNLHRDQLPCAARRCAQINHILKLAKCDHLIPYLILGLNEGWVEFCTDCKSLTNANFAIKPPATEIPDILKLAECVHSESQLHFILGINGDWIEFCAECNKVTDLG